MMPLRIQSMTLCAAFASLLLGPLGAAASDESGRTQLHEDDGYNP